ncbi:Protein of unknown function (DUF1102) [Natrinema pellirubrum DSM 15624]|uniref:DUF1102 domain-containing protein n=1 Tax=Natrinema pellirubrum (strain DSM 15624 / CIP 106293 / JCM 10476 / NCIMB 786 / 157) TaxID=797303 RepID=L0JHD2_NATP1|nr:hypothetical protein [Natrinema pellirubrum]AGB30263.1 Protein of unknown function (DUF1102) [Natrinema pellirubrum DSM 15624]
MRMNRRNVLVGLGTIVAGGGAALGTGAFSSVEAERTVSVETADDSSAFLALSSARSDAAFVNESDGTVQINLDGTSSADGDGVNQNAKTTLDELVQVTNQGTQTVNTLTFEFSVDDTDISQSASDVKSTLGIVSGDATINGEGDDLLSQGSTSNSLESSTSIMFGLEIDLLNSNINNIDDGAGITLTIKAETAAN